VCNEIIVDGRYLPDSEPVDRLWLRMSVKLGIMNVWMTRRGRQNHSESGNKRKEFICLVWLVSICQALWEDNTPRHGCLLHPCSVKSLQIFHCMSSKGAFHFQIQWSNSCRVTNGVMASGFEVLRRWVWSLYFNPEDGSRNSPKPR
jgi:hypothetical protein